MAVTPQQLRDLAPELATVPDGRLCLFIQQAERRVNRAAWGVRADDGVMYLAAHLAIQAGKGASAPVGPVSSVSVGEVSQSFAVAPDGGSLSATSYGQEYLSLSRLVFASRVV